MADFESVIQQSVDTEVIPGCVLLASNRDGSFKYSKVIGTTSMEPSNAKPLQLDTVLWIASCTKLMTSICALQLVERGQLTLDDPVYNHIPELKDFKIMIGVDSEGKPVEVQHTKPITLRTLLTHTSGLSYDSMNSNLYAWLAYHRRQPGTGSKLLQRFDAPLTFEPGESWSYGCSIDYVGLLIERVTDLSLEEYMRQNLWEPLWIKDMTFQLSSRPDMKERLADMSLRDEKSGKVRHTGGHQGWEDAEDCMGGHGVLASAEEFFKVLQAVLTTDEDEKILKRETLREFFKPQLGESSSAAMNATMQHERINNVMGGTPKDQKKSWGLGGLLLLHDLPDGGKASGTMIWSGLPNLSWWVDHKTGLCGLYAGQVMPFGDTESSALQRQFEADVYKKYRESGLASHRL